MTCLITKDELNSLRCKGRESVNTLLMVWRFRFWIGFERRSLYGTVWLGACEVTSACVNIFRKHSAGQASAMVVSCRRGMMGMLLGSWA